MVAIAHSITLTSMPANHYRSGARKDGFIPTIRAVGSSGIVGTTWAAECRRKTFDRSGGGRQCGDIFGRSNFTASQATRPAANANDRLFYIGPTTAENFDPCHIAIAIYARAIFRKSSRHFEKRRLPLWVRMRNTLCEQMFSASPPNSDIPRCGWHFAFVPKAAVQARVDRCVWSTAIRCASVRCRRSRRS